MCCGSWCNVHVLCLCVNPIIVFLLLGVAVRVEMELLTKLIAYYVRWFVVWFYKFVK